jgi:hypothetical protein
LIASKGHKPTLIPGLEHMKQPTFSYPENVVALCISWPTHHAAHREKRKRRPTPRSRLDSSAAIHHVRLDFPGRTVRGAVPRRPIRSPLRYCIVSGRVPSLQLPPLDQSIAGEVGARRFRRGASFRRLWRREWPVRFLRRSGRVFGLDPPEATRGSAKACCRTRRRWLNTLTGVGGI